MMTENVHAEVLPYGDGSRAFKVSPLSLERSVLPKCLTHLEPYPPQCVDFDAAGVGSFRPRRSLADFVRTSSKRASRLLFGGVHRRLQ